MVSMNSWIGSFRGKAEEEEEEDEEEEEEEVHNPQTLLETVTFSLTSPDRVYLSIFNILINNKLVDCFKLFTLFINSCRRERESEREKPRTSICVSLPAPQ